MKGNRVLLAAHRGDRKCCPENTMAAFYSSLDQGVDMIETDIQMTKDGHLIIMHDHNALRTTGVDRLIRDMTLQEVRSLDAGSWFSPQFAHTQVPTVEEFLDWVKNTPLLVNWELKDYGRHASAQRVKECADKLLDAIEEAGMGQRSMVNSFGNDVLQHIYSRVGKRYPIHGQGIGPCSHHEPVEGIADEELFDWVCMYGNEQGTSPLDYPENFAYCTERGILPCICVRDTLEGYEKALALGCRMFTSNDIYAADAILKELKVR